MYNVAITEKKGGLSFKDILWIFSLVLYFAICMNNTWRANTIIWYGATALVLIIYWTVFNGRIPLKDLSFFYWILSFVGFGLLSLLWSLSASLGLGIIRTLTPVIAILFLIHCSVKLGFDINRILKSYFCATLINAVYVLLTVDMQQLGVEQLGNELLEGWNGNEIGYMTAQGALIGCYLINTTKRKFEKLLYLLCFLLLALLTIYTGSRTSFIMLVLEVILYFWLCKPAKMIRNAFILALILILAFYLAMNVKSFYEVLGTRLEGLVALFTGEGEVDASASLRDTFIKNGKQWFSENPIFGYGLNNYKVLNQTLTGYYNHAHNNFIEIAVDLGAVGFVLYYSAYVYLIWKLLKFIKKSRFNAFLLSSLIASLVAQYGMLSYFRFYQNFLLMLCFMVITQVNKEKVAELS